MKACLFIYIIFELVHWKVSFVELIELNQSESETLRISVMELSSKTKPLLLLLLLLFTFSSVSESNQVVTSSSTLISIPSSISTFLFLQPKKKKNFWVVEKTKEQKRKDKTLLPFDLYGLLVLVSLKWNTAQANCALIQKEIKVEHADHLYAIKKRKRKKQTKIWLCSFFPFWVFSFVTKL